MAAFLISPIIALVDVSHIDVVSGKVRRINVSADYYTYIGQL